MLMDARPTPEQRALDDAAIRLAEKLGPTSVGDLDDEDRRERLDAALTQAGWRELRSGGPSEPLASGVEAALVARSLARGACDVAFIGPVLAHDLLRRCASAAADDGVARTVAVSADLRRLGSEVAVDAAGSAVAVALDTDGATLVAVPIVPTDDGSDGVDLTRRTSALAVAAGPPLGALSPDDFVAWEALAVTLTTADLVGVMEGARLVTVPTPPSAASTACPSARSRPCSTCSPRPRRSWRARSASRCTRRGRSTTSSPPKRAPRRPSPRRTAPAPRAPCARPRSRCTAASATRGSASCTCTCAARCCRPSGSVTTARSWRLLAHATMGSADGLS